MAYFSFAPLFFLYVPEQKISSSSIMSPAPAFSLLVTMSDGGVMRLEDDHPAVSRSIQLQIPLMTTPSTAAPTHQNTGRLGVSMMQSLHFIGAHIC